MLSEAQLIKKYEPWVAKHARKYQFSSELDYDDLMSIGNMAIFTAINTYDKSRSKLPTHIMNTIRYSITRNLGGNIKFMSKGDNDLLVSVNVTKRSLPDCSSAEDIAKKTSERLSVNVSAKKVRSLLKLESLKEVSIEGYKNDNGECSPLLGMLEDRVEDRIDKELIKIMLHKAIESLNESDKSIIKMKMQEVPLVEISKEIGITEAGISYRYKSIYKKIKMFLAKNDYTEDILS